jgi:Dolichyl-phosphate-mannose-protein mannosyltransferase
LLLLAAIALPLGLFLPGYFIGRCLGEKLWAPSAFLFSLPILFHCVFWLGVFGVRIQLLPVAALLLIACGAAAWAGRKSARPLSAVTKAPWNRSESILLIASAVVGLILLIHSYQAPLPWPDTRFRWDYLAQRILELGRFNFYPPLHPADFKTYFYVDGIPPLISFEHWWLYACAGSYQPQLICILVAAEFFATLAFTYGTASALFSRRAGVLAAAMLAACPLYFKAVFWAQETGLTALSIAAMLYFIVTVRDSKAQAGLVSAGLAAGVCALSREYGWIALIGGVIALSWRGAGRKQIVVFAAVGAAVAAPWYVRNLMVAGNPFYSLRFLGFAVNPVHDAIMQNYRNQLSVPNWSARDWLQIVGLILAAAVPQILAGIPGGFFDFRKHGYLIVFAVLLGAVWIFSAGYTSAGVEVSLRVLSPAMVVLSITGAGALELWMRHIRWRTPLLIALGACLFWNAMLGVYQPYDPLRIRPGEWVKDAFPDIKPPLEFTLHDQLAKGFPQGYRVLSDSAYLHASLYGTGIDVVPVWSPEVSFLFTASPEEAERRLESLGIVIVVWYPQSRNAPYLQKASPFYAHLDRWRAIARSGDDMLILVPNF